MGTLATWPDACTPASVRPATVTSAGSRSSVAQGVPQDALDGAEPGLGGPAREPRAVVLQVEAEDPPARSHRH